MLVLLTSLKCLQALVCSMALCYLFEKLMKYQRFQMSETENSCRDLFCPAVHCFYFLHYPNLYHNPHQTYYVRNLEHFNKAKQRGSHSNLFLQKDESVSISLESKQKNAWEQQKRLLFETNLIQWKAAAIGSLHLCYICEIPVVPLLCFQKWSWTFEEGPCTRDILDCESEVEVLHTNLHLVFPSYLSLKSEEFRKRKNLQEFRRRKG